MAKKTEENIDSPVTVHHSAPETPAVQQWVMPRHKQIEGGGYSSPVSNRYPQVRGGICEYCGVQDPRRPSTEQYKLCEHYRGQQLHCVYCPKDSPNSVDHVIGHTVLNVADNPFDSSKLVVWCDSYNCSRAHEARFKISQ